MPGDDSSQDFPSQEDVYIPLEEAKQIFGDAHYSTSSLFRLAGEGKIRKRLPSGRQRGAEYNLSDIQRQTKKKIMEHFHPHPRGATDWITPDDLPYVQALDLKLYGPEDTVDFSITYSWWQKNKHMCRILYDMNDRRNVWGALTIMPLNEAVIFHLLRKELAEKDITADLIQVYEPNHSYTGYIASVLILPEYSAHLRSLIVSMLNFWCQQYPSITLSRLYAFASSDEGHRLIHHLFFSPRYDLGENAFELDPLRPNNPSRLIQQFQSCIRLKERM